MKESWPSLVAACLMAVATWLAAPRAVAAHPLGNFTVNRYSRLEPIGESLRLIYVLDMAEIPTFQERAAIDTDRDGQISDVERAAYADRKSAELRDGLSLRVGGYPADLRLLSRSLSFADGQGGLPTLRLEAIFEAATPGRGTHSAEYEDRNYRGRIGWKEVVVRSGPGASILESDAPATDLSDALRRYPDDMLSSPVDRTSARFRFEAAGPGGIGPLSVAIPAAFRADTLLAAPVAADAPAPVFILALAGAALWGALHALSPGHGKTLVAAYLVGARGTPRHAAFLGATVTATHTLGVYALGVVTIAASQYVVPEKLYPWLGVVSGVLVVAIGASLSIQRLRQLLAEHAESRHMHPQLATALGSALSGGGHEHEHSHNHGEHDHGHSHLPGGGESLSGRSLLGLGISGGLLPCPSALVLMLGAIALGQPFLGLVLVLAFSVGLAGVLVALGLLVVYAHRLFGRIRAESALTRLVPLGSALFILAAGMLITLRSLVETGVLFGGQA